MDGAPTLGQVIRSRRLGLGLTQEELAERIGDGVRQAEVSRLECDRVTLPRRRRMERIAAALELPLGELLAMAGWSGADYAFRRPAVASEDTAPFHQTSVPDRHELTEPPTSPSLTELRDALVRSRELHWHTLQLLDATRDLAARWDSGRALRDRDQHAHRT